MKHVLLIVLLVLCSAQSNYKPKGTEGALKGAAYMGWSIRDFGGSLADVDEIVKSTWAGKTNAYNDWIKAHSPK